jgi:hypothetical protein
MGARVLISETWYKSPDFQRVAVQTLKRRAIDPVATARMLWISTARTE